MVRGVVVELLTVCHLVDNLPRGIANKGLLKSVRLFICSDWSLEQIMVSFNFRSMRVFVLTSVVCWDECPIEIIEVVEAVFYGCQKLEEAIPWTVNLREKPKSQASWCPVSGAPTEQSAASAKSGIIGAASPACS